MGNCGAPQTTPDTYRHMQQCDAHKQCCSVTSPPSLRARFDDYHTPQQKEFEFSKVTVVGLVALLTVPVLMGCVINGYQRILNAIFPKR